MRSKLRLWAASAVVSAGIAAVMIAGCSATSSADRNEGTTSDPANGDSPSGAAPAGDRGSEPGAADAPGSRDGHVAFRLVDAPADVKSIVVTVSRLDAEVAGSWRTLVEREETIDLLTLRDGAFLDLGTAELPPGRVGQLRLHLAEGSEAHLTTTDGVDHPVTIPSAARSGIKLVGGFDVPECASGQVTIDFDGERSFQAHQPGAGGGPKGKPSDAGGDSTTEWIMRPVIKIKAVALKGECTPLDAGASDASDASDTPPPDPCAAVTCSDTELCDNGTCRPLE